MQALNEILNQIPMEMVAIPQLIAIAIGATIGGYVIFKRENNQ